MPLPDFSEVTELPGSPATAAQIERLRQRYEFAAARIAGRRTLEVACGAGLGLGLLRQHAASLVGGDCTASLIETARNHYGNRVPLVRLDAQRLPFADASFDAVLLFEAIYYFSDVSAFLAECRRVLSPDGLLVISSVNPDCGGLPASAHSTTYLGVDAMSAAIARAGFAVEETRGGFATGEASWAGRAITVARGAAAALNLIPKTLRMRVLLKRLFYGPMEALPAELPSMASAAEAPAALTPGVPDRTHRIVYIAARRSGAAVS